MISSIPIDEQRAIRMAALSSNPSASTSGAEPSTLEQQPNVYDSDDERDPNDIPVNFQAQDKAQAGKTDDPYDFDESDHSDDN